MVAVEVERANQRKKIACYDFHVVIKILLSYSGNCTLKISTGQLDIENM